MALKILTARHAHRVKTPEQLKARQMKELRKQAASTGDKPIRPWAAPRPLQGYISHGLWVGDCDCGSGVAIDPSWAQARCFACGAVYQVQLPGDDDRLNLEHVLSQRPRRHQHWRPQDGETLTTLAIENVQHGVKF